MDDVFDKLAEIDLGKIGVLVADQVKVAIAVETETLRGEIADLGKATGLGARLALSDCREPQAPREGPRGEALDVQDRRREPRTEGERAAPTMRGRR